MKTNRPTALEVDQATKLKKICPSFEFERQIVCQNEFGHDPRYLFLEDDYLLEKVGLAKFQGESGIPSVEKFDSYSCWIVGPAPTLDDLHKVFEWLYDYLGQITLPRIDTTYCGPKRWELEGESFLRNFPRTKNHAEDWTAILIWLLENNHITSDQVNEALK